ncbi:hypothetical protein P152DRAFT_510367 [Eremomyces bilateralis CBS 781.70]|uniref:Box C/D snoRNA protein 1 n=1 Tax=Eremomyces bilateralis CBS 781.70 TaxID=1392243 RepID=A0A6G1GGR8_9PEZI|nr:uncharacterized protein P152DRAFT_510367 [Eremomyces bilateralis CBS 781.70]KAF1817060.1 hypothetical protein P152DRAFT_510367 [Eremomyces bilateralis CBS 781.70]
MSEPSLLSEMCSICTTQKPKYRCPGCSIRTCSLPCFQRHKAWASCSGKRDPAKYMKKSELSTEPAFDHDYNFLAGIERVIDKAERDVESRGMEKAERMDRGGRGFGRRGGGQGTTGEARVALREETRLKDAVGRAQVIWERAPKGMARRKMNQSHYLNRSKRIRWMVEWIHDDGSKRLGHMIENESLADGYRAMIEPKESRSSKKRKRPSEGEGPVHNESQDGNLPPDQSLQPEPNEVEVAKQPDQPTSEPTPSQGPDANLDTAGSRLNAHSTDPEDLIDEGPPSHFPDRHFYLLMPQTPGKHTVLVPLSAQTILSEALRGRVIMEFPTIYVLPQLPEELPEPFALESKYLRITREQEEEVRGFFGDLDPLPNAATGNSEFSGVSTDVDNSRQNLDGTLAETLAKDVGGLGRK